MVAKQFDYLFTLERALVIDLAGSDSGSSSGSDSDEDSLQSRPEKQLQLKGGLVST